MSQAYLPGSYQHRHYIAAAVQQTVLMAQMLAFLSSEDAGACARPMLVQLVEAVCARPSTLQDKIRRPDSYRLVMSLHRLHLIWSYLCL